MSWISPPRPGLVRSRQSKISGGSTYRPVTRQGRGRLRGTGLLDKVAYFQDALVRARAVVLFHVDDPVQPGLFARHLFDGDGAFSRAFVHFDQLLGGGIRSRNNHVAEQHGERFVADQFLGHEHGVSQPKRFLLPRVAEMHHVADVVHQFGEIGFAFLFQKTFQFRRGIEVVFNRSFSLCR